MFRKVRYVEITVAVVVFLATCWLFTWRMRDIGSCYSSSSFTSLESRHLNQERGPPIPVYIVEEHHEVVKYWFDAVRQGYIPKRGNVLIHIDGHSDGGTPEQWHTGPLFRFPVTHHDITTMMQQNDVFIVAAALAGLIDRYIWVWPAWNTHSNEGQSDKEYAAFRVRYGSLYHKDNATGEPVLQLCACATSSEYKLDNYCFMNNASDDSEEIPIRESECHMKYTGLVEMVSETKAISLISSGTWITAKDSVLLDVDEDFYGVEAAITPLVDAGVNKETIDTVAHWVKRLVCASDVRQERQTDSFFNYLVQTIIDFRIVCSINEKADDSVCNSPENLVSAVSTLQPKFLDNIRERNLVQHLCDNESEDALKELITELCKLNTDQLKAFAEVGICLYESPKTTDFDSERSMRVCYGYNTPNETVVMFHIPSFLEIKQRTEKLRDILTQKQFVPGAVTICRSTRDGYTPRKLFSKIESDIKRVLRDAFPRIREDSFYYDEDLLGGPVGWHGRH
ncbi:UPF0489 protein C5orf22 homolog [Gigantopelta aegis]|uniref:UPF0489 protein C5orf22 homolog n=1 Tax=Gigantopelta aegis TaxID=1735272 RepID=UPI001B88BF88|nr:UPF0489 protein C5orf22 homolog [Gigantopelta aegis]